MTIDEKLVVDLITRVGKANVLVGKDVSARAKHFWNSAPRVAAAIVRPANTEEVADVLALCHQARQCVVTHGGVAGGNWTSPSLNLAYIPQDLWQNGT